ncbi:MAG: DUF805 domain-containing protein [Schwartzia sp.]|nr:DUF805 domain-containing protein [Schwartzia sp. (in: firmicutes)]MBR1886392.1 DUF805 domain-containing protein [Schwartzia sp. (in: firmicutes)]
MAKFCHNCGSPLNGAEKFCPSCGAQVMAAPQPKEEPEEQSQQASQNMNNPPAPRAAQGQPQPAMRQNAPGQNPGRQPYGAFPGQGGPNAAYGMGMMGASAFNGEHYVSDEGIKEMFFRYDNRLNRKRYIMRGLALNVMAILNVLVLFAFASVSVSSTVFMLAWLVSSVVAVLIVVSFFMLTIRRLHDLDCSAWWLVGGVIPIIGFIFGFYLCLTKGTTGLNQYGPDPLEGQY